MAESIAATGPMKLNIAARRMRRNEVAIVEMCLRFREAEYLYRGLDVLTAKPDLEAQRRVPHHLLGAVEPTETMSAIKFRQLALRALDAFETLVAALPLTVVKATPPKSTSI